MFVRNALLILGVVCVLSGLAVGYMWVMAQNAPPEPPKAEVKLPEPPKITIMTAARDIASRALIKRDDIAWKEVLASDLHPGAIVRGSVSEADIVGALSRRAFASGEALIVGDLVKKTDGQFLAAVLNPGRRGITIPVDATQSAFGLVTPDDYVDVILTQNLADATGDVSRRSFAETILREVRVVAVDQMLTPMPKMAGPDASPEQKLPRAVTLELTEDQAEKILAGMQLGRLQLSVRSKADNRQREPEKIKVLAATHDIATRALLQQEDIAWKEVLASELRPESIVRGSVSEADYAGALSLRAFASGEALISKDLIKKNDPNFLASVLQPGMRGLSIPVDAIKSLSSLLKPDDRVDIILTQEFAESGKATGAVESSTQANEKAIAETLFRNIRVIGVDPKSVTLEVTDLEAEKLAVAQLLGKLQLPILPKGKIKTLQADRSGSFSSLRRDMSVTRAIHPQSEIEKCCMRWAPVSTARLR